MSTEKQPSAWNKVGQYAVWVALFALVAGLGYLMLTGKPSF